jgi:hypothetical protein
MTLEWRTLRRGEIDHELLWTAVGLTSVALALAVIPFVGLVPLPCVFKAVTGLPCPTCGATRAVVALSHGDWSSALRLNPLVVLAVAGWTAWLPYGLATGARAGRRVRVACSSRDCTWLRILALAAVAANWLYLVLGGR